MELKFEIVRKPVKTLRVTVLPPDGRVVVSAPLKGCPDSKITEFITSKLDRIAKIRARVLARAADALPEDSAELRILRRGLEGRIAERLPVWEGRLGLRCSGWAVRNMKTRWGSCNYASGKVRFSLMLAKKCDACLDYIIVHELAHLRFPNHGAEFKKFLTQNLPDWKKVKKLL